jgi:hypothetical protein
MHELSEAVGLYRDGIGADSDIGERVVASTTGLALIGDFGGVLHSNYVGSGNYSARTVGYVAHESG